MNTELKNATNRQIQAVLSGPHPSKPSLAAQMLSCHGISPPDTKMLAQWFDSKTLATPFSGKFGYVHRENNQTIVRVFDVEGQYHELKITLTADIDYLATIGQYFGYRTCCSQYYSACKRGARKMAKRDHSHHYVHCPKCRAELTPYDHAAIAKEIAEKRICTTPFPNHPSDVWIGYLIFDAVMRDKMSFARLKNNRWIHTRR